MSNLIVIENGLIPVYKNNENGQVVNARELHEFLEVGKDFTTWIKDRIDKYDFVEDTDFIVFTENGENLSNGGRPKTEYILTLDTAKEIAMVQNNEKGKQVRKYFIAVEKKYKEIQYPKLSKELQAIFFIDQKQQEHEDKLNKLDNKVEILALTMNITAGQAQTIKKLVNKRVKTLCYGDESNAFLDRNLKRKVYSYIWRMLKDYLNVTVYHNILRKDYSLAIKYIETITLQGSLLREVKEANNQIVFNREVAL